jgi:poly(3-hydroxybutyrate) depolymerase
MTDLLRSASFVAALCAAVGCSSAAAPAGDPPVGDPMGDDEVAPADAAAAPSPDGAPGPASPDASARDLAVRAPDAAATPAPTGKAPPMPSPGCGMPGTPPDGVQTIAVNGRDRQYIIRSPLAYDRMRPYRVVFAFHGAHGTMSGFDKGYGFRKEFQDKAVQLFPQALDGPDGYTTWARDSKDDIAFVDAILDRVKKTLCVDAGRVFSTGHSSGGFFSNTLGCQRGGVFRGVAPVSGGPRDMSPCTGQVAYWGAHGLQDTTVALRSGRQARDFFLKRDACGTTTMPVAPSPCVAYDGCAAGFPLRWCEFEGGHVWPAFATKGVSDFFMGL